MAHSQTETVRMGDRGRLVLPASIRSELGLEAGTPMLVSTQEDGSIKLLPYRAIAEATRGMFADLAKDGSLVDDLSAQRRAEAAQEDE